MYGGGVGKVCGELLPPLPFDGAAVAITWTGEACRIKPRVGGAAPAAAAVWYMMSPPRSEKDCRLLISGVSAVVVLPLGNGV